MIGRRRALQILGGGMVAGLALDSAAMRASTGQGTRLFPDDSFGRRMAAIEAGNGGRLGVALLDTATNTRLAWRGEERFPMCSTFKFLLSAAILDRCDVDREQLDRRIAFAATDLVPHSPVTEKAAGGPGLTIAELCEATMTTSDNTAANLLLIGLGGPAALTAWLRTLGDRVTRLDRIEPALNTALPGDPRDTTTPLAMLGDLHRLLIKSPLASASRDRLIGWLVANQTGDTRLRAGIPAGWRVGDKTGSGANGTVNDIGIVWPPGRAPILVASYLTGSPRSTETSNAVHAAVARTIADAVARSTQGA